MRGKREKSLREKSDERNELERLENLKKQERGEENKGLFF